uniref:Protein yippee-like n=1 Tax=Panagrolaimus sp. JU765 TaxID=591449 RepID=A0AC34QHK4_9BILA
MGVPLLEYLDDTDGIYICKKCKACLTNPKMLVSKAFRGSTGTAYLFKKVINIRMGPLESRSMLTGKHIVRDVDCFNCNTRIGWFYEMAFNTDQIYKEGQWILELSFIELVPGLQEKIIKKQMLNSSYLRTNSSIAESSPSFSLEDEKEDITV